MHYFELRFVTCLFSIRKLLGDFFGFKKLQNWNHFWLSITCRILQDFIIFNIVSDKRNQIVLKTKNMINVLVMRSMYSQTWSSKKAKNRKSL